MSHGTYTRTIDIDRTVIAGTRKEAGRQGPTATKRSGYTQRPPLDIAHMRPMERHAQSISPIPDVPPSIQAPGKKRRLHNHTYDASERLEGTVKNRCHRVFYRCNLHGSYKRGLAIGKTKRGKSRKIMAIVGRSTLHLALGVAGVSPHEVPLVESTIQRLWIEEKPHCLIGDKAYDSDALDAHLRQAYSIELIAPHRTNRRKVKTQYGRASRRYCRRWRLESLFAWLHNFRRIAVRYDFHVANSLAVVMLSCIITLLGHF